MIKDKRTQFSKTCKRVLAKEKSSNIMKTRKKVEQDNTLDGKSSENMGFESDDEDTEMPELSSDGSFKKKKFRTRQYSKENKGPFVVCIRAIDEKTPLKPMKLTKLIFGTCASEILIRQVNANKMRVTFSLKTPSDESCDVARREANALPMCEWKFLEKRDNDREKNIQKKTYAEMLRQFDPESLMPGEMEEESVPLNLGTRKERHLKRPSNETSTSNDFVSKKYRVNTTPEETPPGFKNPNFIEEDTITSFINSLLNELELPPFITDLINKFIIPLVHKFVKNITNSFMQKISLLSQ